MKDLQAELEAEAKIKAGKEEGQALSRANEVRIRILFRLAKYISNLETSLTMKHVRFPRERERERERLATILLIQANFEYIFPLRCTLSLRVTKSVAHSPAYTLNISSSLIGSHTKIYFMFR